ncbi:MAG: carbohydrate binding domain-containing protein [Fimbriimonadaceae bacterium]|nr:carbohydrate binding domain-containing protein [Fimbriimonadaceae bacterium]
MSIALILAVLPTAMSQPALDLPTVPFTLRWDQVNTGPTSVAFLNGGSIQLPVTVQDGKLAVGGNRTRLWGTNICSEAAFPTPEQGQIMAQRLAAFGVNAVRFHHLEAAWNSSNIFGTSPHGSTRRLDPVSVDRLDCFVAELKKNGIYSNMNLLVSRTFVAADGLPPEIETVDWKMQGTIAMFDPALIALQKEYATQLLGRVNPYTGMSYADDPAIAFVEINNENSLIQAFYDGWFLKFPEIYKAQVRTKWTWFLRTKYQTDDALKAAWGERSEPLGPEMLQSFSPGSHWQPMAQLGAVVQFTPNGNECTFKVATPGSANWIAELLAAGVPIENRQIYTVKFEAKADQARQIRFNISRNSDPWTALGIEETLSLSQNWQTFQFTFVAGANVPNSRYLFGLLSQAKATFMFRNASLRKGGEILLDPGITLANTLSMPGEGYLIRPTIEMRRDFLEFLRELEAQYWDEMATLLKQDLKIKAIIVPTIVGVSSPHLMNKFDVIDSHGYWAIPTGEFWATNWSIEPKSMVGSPKQSWVAAMASRRIFGKPFMVTEYNHCYPNLYATEGPLFAAIYGSLQDWDAVWHFAYAGSTASITANAIFNPFDNTSHPGQLAHFPAAAFLFRTFGMQPAKAQIWRTMDRQKELELLATVGTPWNNVNARDLGLDPLEGLRSQVGLKLEGDPQNDPVAQVDPNATSVVSDNNQVKWSFGASGFVRSISDKGAFYIGAQPKVDLGILSFTQTWSPRWFTLSVAQVQPNVRLVTLCGTVMNQGMVFNPGRTTTTNQWGGTPTLVQTE